MTQGHSDTRSEDTGSSSGSAEQTAFPRYERISEELGDEPVSRPSAPRDEREFEIPRTESYGELWRRASLCRRK